MPKVNYVPKIDGKVAAYGIVQAPIVPTKIAGDQLWTGRAWVAKSEVVPLDEALVDYSKVLHPSPSPDRLCAFVAMQRNSWATIEGALRGWNQAITVDPRCANPYTVRAADWVAKGKLDLALKDVDTAVRLQPANSSYYVARAGIQVKRREWHSPMQTRHCWLAVRTGNHFVCHRISRFGHIGRGRILGFLDVSVEWHAVEEFCDMLGRMRGCPSLPA
jgi:hypothetical protein